MRTIPPSDFNLSSFLQGVFTFQQWEIFPGITTNGHKHVGAMMDNLRVPRDLQGRRVLDIAPWNGFFTFECLRRGAAEVVSLGPDDPEITGYNRVKALLEAENCRYVQGSIYDLSPVAHGTFDIVLFLGLIYHLRHPLLALDKIFEAATDMLYVDTPIIDNIVFDRTVSGRMRRKIVSAGKVVHTLPLLYYTKGAETGDPYNWFIPNERAFHDLVGSSGFEIVHTGKDGGGWAWLSAVKAERPFTVGVEGFNSAATSAPANN